jgi:5-methylcytosine-specific restriction endonuclease McrA
MDHAELLEKLKKLDEVLLQCPKCLEHKLFNEYYANKHRKTGRSSYCKLCERKRIREYHSTPRGQLVVKKSANNFRKNNPEKIANWVMERRYKNKKEIVQYMGNKCTDCLGVFPLCVYDFHHIDPNTKEKPPAAVLTSSIKTIKKELDKCILLCSNCHRIRHHGSN